MLLVHRSVRLQPDRDPIAGGNSTNADYRLTVVSIGRRAFLVSAAVLPFAPRRRTDPLRRFRDRFTGSIIVPGDAEYDSARAVVSLNPRTDKRPRLIARCANADDVARALEFGREQSLEIAVRGGGHDLLGASACDGGIVIDLSPMKAIRIDPSRRRARVEAGARSRDLNGPAEAHGLVAALGCHPGVGIAGLTLGGGLGWFLGRFGAASDNLRAAHVITADGNRRLARADENADLFWALRGGGGNFGIVTELELKLHVAGPVVGGPIAFRTDVRSFLRFHRDFLHAAPDPLVAEATIVIADQPVILCMVCWSGEPSEGERALAPLRAYGPPVADAIHAVGYAHLTDRLSADFSTRAFGPPSGGAGPVVPTFDYWKGGSLDQLTDQAIDQIVTIVQTASRGMSLGLGHYMHGHVCRVLGAETCLPRKEGQLTYFIDANWRDAARTEAAMDWVDRSWEAMQPHSSRSTYVNYLSRDDDEGVRAAYQSNMQRLVAVKRRYDPSNVFHLNRNVRP
ncbi:MAG TPA: FAD-binding oxidoreductase [Vicinamibacterales bacterium]|nr:FAD-binding oxidoreductase [Vicinamibacterales bacterium]